MENKKLGTKNEISKLVVATIIVSAIIGAIDLWILSQAGMGRSIHLTTEDGGLLGALAQIDTILNYGITFILHLLVGVTVIDTISIISVRIFKSKVLENHYIKRVRNLNREVTASLLAVIGLFILATIMRLAFKELGIL